MVTVIIPALNEAETIGKVIGLVKRSPIVSEIIVVDDKSHDNTVHIARDAGATVYTSTLLGKGASMREGILFSGNEFLLFLDADITTYPEDIVELMALQILSSRSLPARQGELPNWLRSLYSSCFSRTLRGSHSLSAAWWQGRSQ
jgi:glycosyltransferase involved in cell wall biosynthesis